MAAMRSWWWRPKNFAGSRAIATGEALIAALQASPYATST